MVSTGLTRARRFQAALALDPLPASKVQSGPLEFADIDKHNISSVKCRDRSLASLHFQDIAKAGACCKTRVVPHNRQRTKNLGQREAPMNIFSSMYRRHEKAYGVTRVASEGIPCGGEKCDALAATGGMPAGAWR
jgi:hypothetical protein